MIYKCNNTITVDECRRNARIEAADYRRALRIGQCIQYKNL